MHESDHRNALGLQGPSLHVPLASAQRLLSASQTCSDNNHAFGLPPVGAAPRFLGTEPFPSGTAKTEQIPPRPASAGLMRPSQNHFRLSALRSVLLVFLGSISSLPCATMRMNRTDCRLITGGVGQVLPACPVQVTRKVTKCHLAPSSLNVALHSLKR